MSDDGRKRSSAYVYNHGSMVRARANGHNLNRGAQVNVGSASNNPPKQVNLNKPQDMVEFVEIAKDNINDNEMTKKDIELDSDLSDDLLFSVSEADKCNTDKLNDNVEWKDNDQYSNQRRNGVVFK